MSWYKYAKRVILCQTTDHEWTREYLRDMINDPNANPQKTQQTLDQYATNHGLAPDPTIEAFHPGYRPQYEAMMTQRQNTPILRRPYQRFNLDRDAHLAEVRRALALGAQPGDESHHIHPSAVQELMSGHVRFPDPDPYELERQQRDGLTLVNPLPQVPLYHTTTDLASVLQDGKLRTRADRNGNGLGGGDEHTISTTTDPHYAQAIGDGLKIMNGVLSGRVPLEQLIEMAKRGDGANEPYYTEALAEQVDESTQPIRESKIFISPNKLGQYTWRVDPSDPNYLTRDRTEEEVQRNLYKIVNYWLQAREDAGGSENPSFAFADPSALAKIDPNNIGVLNLIAKPGSQGYPVPAEREWRTWHGDALDITGHSKV